MNFEKLNQDDLATNPFDQFNDWFTTAKNHSQLTYANAMCLSTLGTDGYPDARYVLMKEFDKTGIIFYTNENSTKGIQIENHSKVALTFYWELLNRQIRIQGAIEKVKNGKADNYFSTRPRNSQLSAWASKQSEKLSSREILLERYEKYKDKFEDKEIPRPSYWTGYQVQPINFEFWQHREDRLHDRFLYSLVEIDKWKINRLYP